MIKRHKIPIIFSALALCWSLLLHYVYEQEHKAERDLVVKLALAEARGSYNKDLVYRRWVSTQGGVYVKPSQFSPPNPYLSHIPDRDLKATDGQDLTLINPAYMTRQVHELAQDQYGAKSHITSLNPLRPENAPDPWEKESLENFHQGAKETTIETTINNEPFLRLMLPMITEEICLKCHGHQGYKVGDIRGGISISIPLARYFKAQNETLSQETNNKILLWTIGMILLGLCYYAVQKHLNYEKLTRFKIERSEKKYRTIFDESTVGLVLADVDSGIIYDCNQKILELTERNKDEIIGKPQAILHEKVTNLETLTDEFVIHRDEAPGSLLETTLLTKSGTRLPVEIKAEQVVIDTKTMLLGMFRDLSRQKEAESQLRQNEKTLRAVLNSQYDAVFLYRVSDGQFKPFEMVNAIALKRYGYSRETFLSLTPMDITEDTCNIYDLWNDVNNDISPHRKINIVMSHRKRSGEIFPVEVCHTKLQLEGTEYRLSVARDISERVRFQKKSQDLLVKLQQISNQVPGMVYQFEQSVDGQFSIPFVSDAIVPLFELTPDDVKENAAPLIEKIYPDDTPATIQSIELSANQLSPWRHEFRLSRKDGTTRWLEGNSLPKRQEDGRTVWYGHIIDITDRKAEEAKRKDLFHQLRQREKINAIGMLASGIAHNFNNHLAVILGNLDLAKRPRLSVEDRLPLLENAHIAASRGSDMVRQLMRFNRQPDQFETSFNLSDLLAETGQLLQATLPAAIKKDIQLPADRSDFTIKANATRIQDILLNLCTNAVHAMNERGTLTLSLKKVSVSDKDQPTGMKIAPGSYVCLSVCDTGCGMTEDTVSKIFNPFFTTKEVGQGTGLGLATAKDTVEHYDGGIAVDSAPDQGTTFYVYLPTNLPEHQQQLNTSEPKSMPGTERILLVDDEPMMVELAVDMLKNLGYRVVFETDSLAALDIFQKDPDGFDLVLTDQIMPSLTGIELAQKIKEIRGDIPIVLVTGYSLEVTEDTMAQYGIREMCRKPFAMTEISTILRRVLDQVETISG